MVNAGQFTTECKGGRAALKQQITLVGLRLER